MSDKRRNRLTTFLILVCIACAVVVGYSLGRG